MTYKQIEQAREIRMWLGQVIVPSALVVATVMSDPQTKCKVLNKCNQVKSSIKQKFHKN